MEKIVFPNSFLARGERISIPHSGVRLHSVALHLLSKQHLPMMHSLPSARGGGSNSIMFDNLITPCILSPLTSSDQHMLSPFVYMLESISTGNELISLSAVILVHTCTTCTSCSFYHTGLPHLTATFTLGTHWVCSGYPSTHWVPLPEFRVRFGISPT